MVVYSFGVFVCGKLWIVVVGAGIVCVCVEMVFVFVEMGGK